MLKVLKSDTTPFYKRLFYVLFSVLALGYLTILGKEVLSPLIFAILFSIALLPLANFLEKKIHLPRSGASGLTVIIFIAAIALLFYLVGSQVANLASDWPKFQEQLASSLDSLQDWISSKYDIDARKQMSYVHSATSKIMASGSEVVGTTVLSVSSIMLFLIFTLIDTFFMLLYRGLIMKFLVNVFKKEDNDTVHEIVEQVQMIIRKYIGGLLLEMALVATIVCVAFLILGVKYAILLGLITGLFNVIPYLGIFTALIISLLITFATALSMTKVLLVLIVIVAMHLIDSNVFLPLIVGSKVKINALITILGVIIGEMLWGIPGMFLSIPVIAVIKIVFDRIESLRPWGMLLGEEDKEVPKTIADDESPEVESHVVQ